MRVKHTPSPHIGVGSNRPFDPQGTMFKSLPLARQIKVLCRVPDTTLLQTLPLSIKICRWLISKCDVTTYTSEVYSFAVRIMRLHPRSNRAVALSCNILTRTRYDADGKISVEGFEGLFDAISACLFENVNDKTTVLRLLTLLGHLFPQYIYDIHTFPLLPTKTVIIDEMVKVLLMQKEQSELFLCAWHKCTEIIEAQTPAMTAPDACALMVLSTFRRAVENRENKESFSSLKRALCNTGALCHMVPAETETEPRFLVKDTRKILSLCLLMHDYESIQIAVRAGCMDFAMKVLKSGQTPSMSIGALEVLAKSIDHITTYVSEQQDQNLIAGLHQPATKDLMSVLRTAMNSHRNHLAVQRSVSIVLFRMSKNTIYTATMIVHGAVDQLRELLTAKFEAEKANFRYRDLIAACYSTLTQLMLHGENHASAIRAAMPAIPSAAEHGAWQSYGDQFRRTVAEREFISLCNKIKADHGSYTYTINFDALLRETNLVFSV